MKPTWLEGYSAQETGCNKMLYYFYRCTHSLSVSSHLFLASPVLEELVSFVLNNLLVV